ncbi:MAG: SH3 domain-containing protein [bacterium]|nr:SH3 domain-containing protein [bacterium]
MKKIKKVLYLVLCMLIIISAELVSKTGKQPQILYNWADSVRIRSKASVKSSVVAVLKKGDAVLYSGEKSSFSTAITIRGKKHNKPWYKIETGTGEKAWVYSAFLQKKPLVKNRKAIIVFTDTDDVSEDWNWFYSDIMDACKGKNIYVSHSQLNKNMVPIGPREHPYDFIDIATYLKTKQAGYLFIHNKKIKYEVYDLSDFTLDKAGKFFKQKLKR